MRGVPVRVLVLVSLRVVPVRVLVLVSFLVPVGDVPGRVLVPVLVPVSLRGAVRVLVPVSLRGVPVRDVPVRVLVLLSLRVVPVRVRVPGRFDRGSG